MRPRVERPAAPAEQVLRAPVRQRPCALWMRLSNAIVSRTRTPSANYLAEGSLLFETLSLESHIDNGLDAWLGDATLPESPKTASACGVSLGGARWGSRAAHPICVYAALPVNLLRKGVAVCSLSCQ